MYVNGKNSKTLYTDFGKISKGNTLPDRNVKTILKINRGAQTSGLQKASIPISTLNRKKIIQARIVAMTVPRSNNTSVWINNGGCKRRIRIVI